MARKGRLEEIFSRALHSDEDAGTYTLSYRDFDRVIEVSLPEFIELSQGFEVIPASRILQVKRGGEVLYLKHGFSPR